MRHRIGRKVNLLEHRISVQTQLVLDHAVSDLTGHLLLGHLILGQLLRRKPSTVYSGVETVIIGGFKLDRINAFNEGFNIFAVALDCSKVDHIGVVCTCGCRYV